MKIDNKNKNKESTLEYIKHLENIKLKYNTLLETIPYMVWFMDTEGKYQDINKALAKHSKKDIDNIIGKGHKHVWDLKIGNECEQNDLTVLENKCTMKFEEGVPGAYGYREFDIYRSPVIDDDDQIIGIIAVGIDITEVKNKETQLRTLIENIPFEVWQYDIYGNIVSANEKYAKFNNLDLSQMIGKNIDEVYSEVYAYTTKKENEEVIESKKTKKSVKIIEHDNVKKVIDVYKTPILDIENNVTGIVGILIDITEINEAKEKVKIQAYTDYSTNLLNRRALYEYINGPLKNRKKTIMILDLDNFKYINDTYGHYAGDKLLIAVSKTLKAIHKDDYVFRFGGDEFIIVFDKNLDKETIKYKSEKILNEISKISIENEKVGASIGVASCYCSKDCSECRLIIKADLALYEAKKYKENKYIIYTEELEKESIFRYNLEKDLNNIINNNEIKLLYQPQYTSNGKLIGFEALFRWDNNKYNHISVEKIIEIMEKNKMIISVGDEIIRKCCKFAKQINQHREDSIVVSFNVSAVQIMSNSFIDSIKNILEEIKVYPKHIAIEITETVILKDMDKCISKINEIKKLGIKIYLDDFGTGYSSFSYLVKLPISKIKIDKSFSMEMYKYKDYIKLIKLIVDASHSLNLEVVAEGVETKEQLKTLTNMGADYMQGYLFYKPLEEDNAIKLLQEE